MAGEDVFGFDIGGLFGGGGGGAPSFNLGTSPTLDVSGISPGGMAGFSPTLDTSGIPGVAGASAPGGGSFWDTIKGYGSDIGGIAKAALPAVQLGATGMGIASGIQGMRSAGQQMDILKRQQKAQEQMAAPAAAAGGALTSAGASALQGGALPPQLESQAQQYEDQIRAQYRQYLSSIGQTDSTAMVSMEAQIKQMAAAYREQLAQQLYSSGLQGIGTAMGPSSAVSQTAAGLANPNALAAANAATTKLLGSQA